MRDPFCAVSTADLGRARCAFFFFFSRSVTNHSPDSENVFTREGGGPLADSFGGVRSLVGPSFRSSRPDPSAGAGASPP